MPVISAVWEASKRGLWSRPARTETQDCISKITNAKRAGSVAQVEEHLLNKCKALSSNSSIKNK
jgi:hypothetical protein